MSTATVEKGVAAQPAARPEPLWRRGDIAQLFGISAITVRGWQKAGHLPEPACTIAGRSYWKPATIRALLEKQEPAR